jgi:hypothetical protein
VFTHRVVCVVVRCVSRVLMCAGDAWQNFVKYRLLLVREEEGLGGRPSFWACINKPSLTLSLPAPAASGADRPHSLGTPFPLPPLRVVLCCVADDGVVLAATIRWWRREGANATVPLQDDHRQRPFLPRTVKRGETTRQLFFDHYFYGWCAEAVPTGTSS